MTERPIRIALVITELEMGGAERCLANIACGLDRGRFEPAVYSLASRPESPRDGLTEQLADAGVPTHFLGFSSKWELLQAVRSMVRLLRRQAPDVIQSMLFHANVVAGLARRRLPDCALSLGIRVADPARWRQTVERRVCHQADRVVCVSQMVADFVARQIKTPSDKLTVIPNGVNVADFASREMADLTSLGVPTGRRVVVCISRLERQKGVDRLLAITPQLFAGLPHHDLLIVGDGRQAASLRRMAAQLGVQSRVHFAGWSPQAPEILHASDLLILPSRWEGMPNVLLEAMACGRPVVSTCVEGVGEALGPLSDEQMAMDDEPETLVSKVLAILRDPVAAQRLGRRNQNGSQRNSRSRR